MILLDVTKHACDRAKERFGIDPNQAKFILNKALNESRYLQEGENDTKLYLSENDIVLVVSKKENKIITCYSKGEVPVVLTEAIRDEYMKEQIKHLFEKRIHEINIECYEIRLKESRLSVKLNNLKYKILLGKLIESEVKEELELLINNLDEVTRKKSALDKKRSYLINDFSFILNEDLKKYINK